MAPTSSLQRCYLRRDPVFLRSLARLVGRVDRRFYVRRLLPGALRGPAACGGHAAGTARPSRLTRRPAPLPLLGQPALQALLRAWLGPHFGLGCLGMGFGLGGGKALSPLNGQSISYVFDHVFAVRGLPLGLGAGCASFIGFFDTKYVFQDLHRIRRDPKTQTTRARRRHKYHYS